jgi:hypothetical protein
VLATGDLTSTMEQGGCFDACSVVRYSHDVPEWRRRSIGQMPHRGHVFATRAGRGRKKRTLINSLAGPIRRVAS